MSKRMISRIKERKVYYPTVIRPKPIDIVIESSIKIFKKLLGQLANTLVVTLLTQTAELIRKRSDKGMAEMLTKNMNPNAQQNSMTSDERKLYEQRPPEYRTNYSGSLYPERKYSNNSFPGIRDSDFPSR